MKVNATAQLAMPVDDPEQQRRDRQREIDEQRELMEAFFGACRAFVRDESSYEAVATELESVFGELGRHVSHGVLKNTLAPNAAENRQYFRFEWAIWFAAQSEECAELLAAVIGRRKPTKSAEQELADLKEVLHNEYPRQATRLIRKGQLK